jgi:hypothetical protein
MNPANSVIRLVVLVLGCASLHLAAAPQPNLKVIPFASRSGTGERMTFTAIPASESGLVVENPYNDPAMWGEHYAEFQGGAIGTGLALGDVDGDGLVDIYVVNKIGPNKLFRQISPFKFVDITDQAGVGGPVDAWKTGATMADVNNDGFLDIYVCRFNAPNLLYLNDGHGHFKESAHAAGIDLVAGSVVGAFEDYDRDGFLDLFVVTNVLDMNRSPNGETSHLFHNRGDGTFEDVSVKAGISQEKSRAHSASWFDYNGDGWPDLYEASDFTPADHFYRNNGDGTFTDVLAEAVPHTPWFSMGSDSADINNDGLVDFIVADMAATTHFKSKVAMGDMGGLVTHMDTLVTPQYMKNAVFLNSGTDRFLEVAKMTGLSSTDWTWSLRFEDLDNDGWVDLHVTNGMVRNFINSDLLATAKNLQSPQEMIALFKGSPLENEMNLCYRNDKNLHFTKVQKEWGLDHLGISFGSAFADLDNDGDLDLVYVNYEGNVSLYRNDCPATNHSIIVQLKGTKSNSYGVGAQVFAKTAQGLQTRQLTIARGALSSSEPVMHFGLGTSTEVESLEVRWPSGEVQTFKNLAGGNRYIITEPAGVAKLPPAIKGRPLDHGLMREQARDIGIDYVNTERDFNDMTRQSLLPNRMNTLGGGIAWGDANGDGFADIFFAGGAGSPSALYLADGHGHFKRSTEAQPWDGHPEREAMSALWIDVNGDGALDLMVSMGGVESDKGSDALRNRLYLNDGKGHFTEAPATQMPNPPVSSSVVCAADYNRDGTMDVFVGGRVVPGEYPTAPESMLLENRHGVLVDVTDQACPVLRHCGMVTAALWTDADGDGRLDLLVAGEWMTLRLFHNNGDGTFTETTAAAGFDRQSGWWNSLIAADLNGDGAIDYIAGNVGLNTKYHASEERPVTLYYGDFEGSGKKEIVEGEYEGDKLYPVRGRSCSSRAMPSLKGKFPTFHDFGAALLPEIYSPEKLGQALRMSANELASGVFMNDGHGHFTFHPLPRLAQTSPIFGMTAVDMTGDGNVDLVIAQNFNGPQVETGRFDGGLGLLLVGDGKGDFRPAMPPESGLAIVGEGRGLAVGDWNRDGWPEFVVTRINQGALAFSKRVKTTGHSFAVKLAGENGNRDAIGSRITVRYKNGSLQAVELYAGSGYLSQSEALAFFGYATGNEPKTIEVVWPDGTKTTHPFKAHVPQMVLKKK